MFNIVPSSFFWYHQNAEVIKFGLPKKKKTILAIFSKLLVSNGSSSGRLAAFHCFELVITCKVNQLKFRRLTCSISLGILQFKSQKKNGGLLLFKKQNKLRLIPHSFSLFLLSVGNDRGEKKPNMCPIIYCGLFFGRVFLSFARIIFKVCASLELRPNLIRSSRSHISPTEALQLARFQLALSFHSLRNNLSTQEIDHAVLILYILFPYLDCLFFGGVAAVMFLGRRCPWDRLFTIICRL